MVTILIFARRKSHKVNLETGLGLHRVIVKSVKFVIATENAQVGVPETLKAVNQEMETVALLEIVEQVNIVTIKVIAAHCAQNRSSMVKQEMEKE